MAASEIYLFRNNIDLIKIGDLSTATIKLALTTSAWTPNDSLTGHTIFADISNELSAGNGYVAGGATLTTPAVTSYGTNGFKFSTDNATWTASGGSILAWRYGALYVSGSLWGLASPLIGYFIGDSTPADMPDTLNGQALEIVCPSNGWFTSERA
jgi:hypothetical protein